MSDNDIATLQKILDAGMNEFLDKGFEKASLRKIVNDAGVTTGAFYGYFSSKSALFSTLVEEHASYIMGRFMQAQEEFSAQPAEVQSVDMINYSKNCIDEIIDYAFEHYNNAKLLFCKADGTSYENFVHNMVEVEVESTFMFIKTLQSLGYEVPTIDKSLCHMICSGMLNGVFEMIVHDYPKEEAIKNVSQLEDFYNAGWMNLFGI